ncbi:MAG TPA: hypothetical protein VFT66_00250, partial [Roseiflexaceae bacterium]|nr:hypothetical protein [Roseiflexaceae bacterium]
MKQQAFVEAPAPSAWRSWNLPVTTLRRLIVPLALLCAWQIVTALGWFSPSQLPGPLDVLAACRELIARNELWTHIAISLQRVLLGFAAGSLLAIALGGAVGLSQQVEEYFGPTLNALRAIPSLAWVPLLVLWMGVDEGPKVTLVAIGV